MKKNPLFQIAVLTVLSLAIACGPKATGKSASEPSGKDRAQGPVLPPTARPAAPGSTPETVIAAPRLSSIAELGTPMFAVQVNLQALLASAFVRATGLDQELGRKLFKSKERTVAENARCLGVGIDGLSGVLNQVTVAGKGPKEYIILLETSIKAERFVQCMKADEDKQSRVTEEMFGTIRGYRTVDKDGDVGHYFALSETAVLLILGEQKPLISRLKIGQGDLGRGDLSGYFHGGAPVVSMIMRDLPLHKFNDADSKNGTIPKLQDGDLDGWMTVTDTVKLEFKLETGNSQAAEQLVALFVLMKNAEDVQGRLQALGIEQSLLDEVRFSADGEVVKMKMALDAELTQGIAKSIREKIDEGKKAPKSGADE